MSRLSTLRERALELLLARVLRAMDDITLETEVLHRELATARTHILKRIAWRRRKGRASAIPRRRFRDADPGADSLTEQEQAERDARGWTDTWDSDKGNDHGKADGQDGVSPGDGRAGNG